LKDSLLHINDSFVSEIDTTSNSIDTVITDNFFGGNIPGQHIQSHASSFLNSNPPDWLSLIFIGAIIYFIIIKFIFNINFYEGLKGILKIEVLDDVGFEKKHHFLAFLFSPFAIIVYSYYLYFLINPLYLKLELDYLFLVFALALAIIFLIKKMLEFFISFIFNTFLSFKAYLLDHLYILGIGSIIQLILLVFYTYSQLKIILWMSIGVLIIFFIYRLIRSFIIGYQLTSFSKSYLFLYLCSLEILPLIWIYKVISDYP